MSIINRVKQHISNNRGKYGAAAGAGAMYGASQVDSPLLNQAGFNVLAKGQNLALDVADKIDPRATVALNDLGMHKIRQEDIDASNAWVSDKKTLVEDTRTINGKALSADITLGAVYTATLTAAGWVTSGAWKTQTVSVTGLKASYNAAPFVDVALSGTDAAADAELAAAWLGISASAIANTAENSLTVKFPATVDTPTVNIPIRITTYD